MCGMNVNTYMRTQSAMWAIFIWCIYAEEKEVYVLHFI